MAENTEPTVVTTAGTVVPIGQVIDPLIAMYGRRLKMLEDQKVWLETYSERAHDTLIRVMATLQRRGEWELAEEVRKALEARE